MKKLNINATVLKCTYFAITIAGVFISNEMNKRTVDESAKKAVAKHIEEHPELFQK